MGVIEGFCILFIILALDTDSYNALYFYSLLFLL